MDATAFDYLMRDVLRALFSPYGMAIFATAISLRAFRRAMAAEDYAVKAWAIDRGLKGHAHASRQLSGEKPINQADIDAAPLAVQRWYHLFRLEEIGLPPITMTAAQLHARLERTA